MTPIKIYTDGAFSRKHGKAGIGIYMEIGSEKRHISEPVPFLTNNIAELQAIGRALMDFAPTDRKIDLITDSKYSQGVLTKGWRPKVNHEIIAGIKKQIENFPGLTIHHVRGHQGFYGNEVADFLATCQTFPRCRVVNYKAGEEYDVYIGRPSAWGNYFHIGKDGTRSEVIEKYRVCLLWNKNLLKKIPQLQGKVLGCSCKPLPCHGDILVKMVNEFTVKKLSKKLRKIKNGNITK